MTIDDSKNVKDNSFLKNFTSNIPSITVYILLLGLIKQLLYYRSFHVPIKYFLGLSEVGLFVADDLLLFVPLMLFAFFISYLYSISWEQKQYNDKTIISSTPINENNFNKKTLAKKIISKFQKYKEIIGLILVTILSVFLIFKIIYTKHYYAKLVYFTIMSQFILGAILYQFAKPIADFFKSHKITNLSIFLIISNIFVLFYIFFTTGFDIKKVQNGNYNDTIIITNDSTYTSTPLNYFIGRTEKYVFIYNVKDTSTTILPSESVKKMVIKMKL